MKVTHFTLLPSKTESFIIKMLPWNWLKRRGKSVPKECCGYFSHSLDVYEVSPRRSPWTISRHCCRDSSGKLQRDLLQSLKRKGFEVTFCQHDFKCNGREHHFVYFYEVIINCYPNFMAYFYFPFACVRSNSSHCQLMDLLKSKKVIINCYPNFMAYFYFPLAYVRSNSSHCQLMDLFKSKKSFKEKVDSDNNWKAEWF